MAQVSRATFATNLATKVNDNTGGDITPQDIRETFTDLEDSAVWYDEMPAATSVVALSGFTPVLTDIAWSVDDPGGTPVNGKVTWQNVMDLFEANIQLTESNITDLGNYLTTVALDDVSDVTLTSAAQGDILYRNASGWVNLGPGTSGHFLKTNGAGANPEWAAGAGGGIANVVEDTTPQLGGSLDLNDFGATVQLTNDNAGTINKGQPVYIKSNGNVDLADADAAATTTTTIGLVADATIATTAAGAICTFGVVDGFDTSGLTAGALVYVATGTAGALTTTQPSSGQIKPIGICLESHASTGRVLVTGSGGWSAIPLSDGASLKDTSGNELLEFGVTASAVNHTKTTNAATGNAPSVSAVGGDTNINLVLLGKGTGVVRAGGTTAAYDVLTAGVADQLTAAFTAAVDDDGTQSSGTYTPSVAAGSNFKQITNNGAFTFAPPSPAADEAISLTVRIINAASAGAITTSGFTQVTGDAFTTTNTHEFRCYVEVFDDGGTETSLLHVVAMQ